MATVDIQAKNLAVIDKALKTHADRCPGQILEIQMNPYEVERLGWDDYKGIPITGNGDLGTGMLRLVCDLETVGSGKDAPDAIPAQEERELAVVGAPPETPWIEGLPEFARDIQDDLEGYWCHAYRTCGTRLS